jgi:hypothetical protein
MNALVSNTDGGSNTANGYQALYHNTDGIDNTATGFQTLFSNTGGHDNTVVGVNALLLNTGGNYNTAIGVDALDNNTIGGENIALGEGAGFNLTTGDNNIDIGNDGVAGESNTIRIGDYRHSETHIAGIAAQTVGVGGTTCYVDNDGKLGVFLSARRYKQNIQRMDDVSAALYSLKPVTFCYKPEFDKSSTPQFGLIAEEVADVSPELVTHDAKGQLSTVRYEAVNAMLLNEFLKEHKKTEKLEATVASLAATVKEQASQIQKVSAQVEASKPAPQVVNNP